MLRGEGSNIDYVLYALKWPHILPLASPCSSERLIPVHNPHFPNRKQKQKKEADTSMPGMHTKENGVEHGSQI